MADPFELQVLFSESHGGDVVAAQIMLDEQRREAERTTCGSPKPSEPAKS
ncbi:MAG: hypothetical protein KA155_02645 [Alphaproteobacteria bacterium]|jgi:hypothetical protein|nr:hypothetical protein [Alphaproteobacteria bacterium]